MSDLAKQIPRAAVAASLLCLIACGRSVADSPTTRSPAVKDAERSSRTILVRLDLKKLTRFGISAGDASCAINAFIATRPHVSPSLLKELPIKDLGGKSHRLGGFATFEIE